MDNRGKKEDPSPKRERNEDPKGSPRKAFKPRYDSYAELTTTRAQIFQITKAVIVYNYPPKMRNMPRNHNKFCKFHEEDGHETNDCFSLKDEIERLIREEYIKEYVKGDYPLVGSLNNGNATEELYVN